VAVLPEVGVINTPAPVPVQTDSTNTTKSYGVPVNVTAGKAQFSKVRLRGEQPTGGDPLTAEAFGDLFASSMEVIFTDPMPPEMFVGETKTLKFQVVLERPDIGGANAFSTVPDPVTKAALGGSTADAKAKFSDPPTVTPLAERCTVFVETEMSVDVQYDTSGTKQICFNVNATWGPITRLTTGLAQAGLAGC
jgi:hypothetical protein